MVDIFSRTLCISKTEPFRMSSKWNTGINLSSESFYKNYFVLRKFFSKMILHRRMVCKDWGRNIYHFASSAIPRTSIGFHFLLTRLGILFRNIASCPFLRSCASCRWSLVDLTIGEEIDAKCQHAREIIRSWLPFDRRTCIVHPCNVFFTDSPNHRLQFYRVNFKTRELIIK